MSDQSSGAIKRVNPPELGVPPGYSQVVEVRGGRIIFIAGQTALATATLSAKAILHGRQRRYSKT
jgi:enamine deaminase RidA (YjgF/YER057c/UK114 family)